MSAKVLFCVLALIGLEVVLLAAVENPNADAELEDTDSSENATDLVSKQRADAEIQKILYGDTQNFHECVITNSTSIRNTTKYDNRPVWTVVILKEEIILNQTFNIQQCSGSLIHAQVVLTAAHCVFNKSLKNLKVRAGVSNRRTNGNSEPIQERRIESFEFMKVYEARKPKQDIALLFLKTPFKVSPHVKTVCIPPANVQLDVDYVRCFTTGWARQSNILPGHANFRKINMTVIPSENCEIALQLTRLGEDFTLHKSFMCAGGHFNKAALDVNGGAPLVCPICEISGRMIQVGVMSWGFKDTPLPEIFASVSRARRWIWEEFKKKGLQVSGCGIKWNKRQGKIH